MRIAVPSYFWPGKDWDRMLASRPALVVINPASGPGEFAIPDYKDAVRKARTLEVPVLGYIATTWGAKPIAEVKAERFAYKTFYGVQHFFYDEAATGPDMAHYYRRLVTPKSVINPGAIPDACYRPLKMTMMNYETDVDTYLAKPAQPAWVGDCNPRLWWHCVSNVPDIEAAKAVLQVARERNAGFVWITDDVENNPYDTLPPYYEALAGLAATA